MYEMPDEEVEEPQEERTFEVTEAIPDVELFGFRNTSRSLEVLSGAYVFLVLCCVLSSRNSLLSLCIFDG